MTIEEADALIASETPFVCRYVDNSEEIHFWFHDYDIHTSYPDLKDAGWSMLTSFDADREYDNIRNGLVKNYTLIDFFDFALPNKSSSGHACVCPVENFTVSPIGCQCGGT